MEHKVEFTLTPNRVRDLFEAVLSKGDSHWLFNAEYLGSVKIDDSDPWWCNEKVFEDKNFAARVDFDDISDANTGLQDKIITHADIQKGLELLKNPETGDSVAFGRIIADDEDDEDADLFLQLVIMGG